MSINRVITITVINNQHFAISGESVGEDHFPLFNSTNLLPHGSFDFQSLTEDLGCKLMVFGFTEAAKHLPFNRPIELSAHAFQTTGGRSFLRLGCRAPGK